MESTNEARNKSMIIIQALAENPRGSIREIASRTGLNYLYVRRKIRGLQYRKIVSFSLMVSTNMLGREASIVRIKGRNVDRILDDLSHCNRVLWGLRINGGEIIMIFISRNKHDIAEFIDLLRSMYEGITELHVENGVLGNRVFIPVKNGLLNCNIPIDCLKCLSRYVVGVYQRS
jgi:DNA-binding Lrp family transcriptional regulator